MCECEPPVGLGCIFRMIRGYHVAAGRSTEVIVDEVVGACSELLH